jgi:hypothetical protein
MKLSDLPLGQKIRITLTGEVSATGKESGSAVFAPEGGSGDSIVISEIHDPVIELIVPDESKGLGAVAEEAVRNTGTFPEDQQADRSDASWQPPPYVPNKSLPPAWLVDVDGTLAIRDTGPGARSPYDWSRVGEDAPNMPVIRMVQGLAQTGAYIVVVSGRDAVCARSTQAWLEENMVPVHALFLRKRGDTRDEAVVKSELLDLIATGWQVLGVVDDRDQVVDMWRARGLTCAQVAPGKP